jgi:transposase
LIRSSLQIPSGNYVDMHRGHSRAEAARLNGMDRQTLRDWVHRYNDEGVGGLSSRLSPGRPAALSPHKSFGIEAPFFEPG